MSLSKKHYEEIAHILDANMAKEGIVLDFADYLAEDNPRFDRARFVYEATNLIRLNMAGMLRRLDRAAEL